MMVWRATPVNLVQNMCKKSIWKKPLRDIAGRTFAIAMAVGPVSRAQRDEIDNSVVRS